MTRIGAGSGVAVRLERGDVLRIIAVQAEQVADLALFTAADKRDAFSAGRTIDYNQTLNVRAGTVLYSHRSIELARVVEDTVGVHDMLLAPCSGAMFERRGQHAHKSCLENLCAAISSFGIVPQDAIATLNVFMDVRVDGDRRVSIHPPPCKAGDAFAVQALTALIAGVTACSSELTNAGSCKPVAYEVLRARAIRVGP